jgi:uncharacterized protein YndB with AHSA1/START domain
MRRKTVQKNDLLPVVKTITVQRSASSAFSVFVEEIAFWWPLKTHSMAVEKGAPAPVSVAIEPFVGGRIYETDIDGATCDWGKVLAYEEGRRLRLLWQLGRPAAIATEVEIRFEALGEGECRVVLTHEHWSRLGERADEMRREYESGWDIVFGSLYFGRCG